MKQLIKVHRVAGVGFCMAFAAIVWGGSAKLSSDLTANDPRQTECCGSVSPQAMVDVIVRYRSEPTAENHRKVIERGGLLRHRLGTINAAHYPRNGIRRGRY